MWIKIKDSRGINKLEGNLYLKELAYIWICNEKYFMFGYK